MKPSLEEILFKLDMSYRAMMKSDAIRDQFQTELIAEAQALINERYKGDLAYCSQEAIKEIKNKTQECIDGMIEGIMAVFYREQ